MPEKKTTIQLPIPVRDRLKVVAAKEKCTMQDWVERRVTDAETH